MIVISDVNANVREQAVTISAFMLLLVEFVAATSSDQSVEKALERKDKRKLPFPVRFVPHMYWIWANRII